MTGYQLLKLHHMD